MLARSRVLVGLVLALFLLPACGRDTGGNATEGAGGTGAEGRLRTLVYLRGGDTKDADPAPATDGESAILLSNVFDTLVRFKYGSFEIEPGLATSWTIADDKLSLVLKIRDGLKFHDGTTCDAAACANSFERQRDPKHPHRFEERYSYWGDMFGSVSHVTAPDASTVRFEFSEPMPPFFLSLLAMFTSSIVSPAALAKGKEFVATHPVGTGAFRFVSWTRNSEIVLDANPDWYGGRPKIDRLVLKVKPDPRDAYLALEAGQAQGIDAVAPRDVARAKANPSLVLHEVNTGLSICYLAMNNDVAPFTDVRVRRAVALAIDKARINQSAYEGMAVPISTLVPPGVEGHVDLPDRKRDVAAAKQLLADAGASGAKVRLHYMSNPRPYVPDPNALAIQIGEDLKQIGLSVELKKEEWNVHLPLLQNGEHQMGILGWTADVPDADNYLYVLLDKEGAIKGSAGNVSFYRSDAFHEKVAKARRSYDPAERSALYAEAERIAFDDAPLVPLVAMARRAIVRASVKGFVLDPMSSPRFAWTSLSD